MIFGSLQGQGRDRFIEIDDGVEEVSTTLSARSSRLVVVDGPLVRGYYLEV